MLRIMRFLMAGAIGGFIIWALTEPFDYLTPGAPPGHQEPDISIPAIFLFGAIIGLVFGVSIGVAQAMSGMSLRDGVRTVMSGAGIGAIGGMFGFRLGSLIYFGLSRPSSGTPVFIAFVMCLVGRSLGWGILGASVGAAVGIGSGSTKKMWNGVIGGGTGGLVIGAGYEIMSVLVKSGIFAIPPAMFRMVTFPLIGAAIGLFIGFIEELTKQAWVKLLKGRNEGKEFILFKPLTILGRDELADIPVFGDTSVGPRHAAIEQDNHRYVLRDLGTTFGTSVNGNRISEQMLKDGDTIELGSMKLVFYEKATASKVGGYVHHNEPKSVQIPSSSAVCPYCGGVKDAGGNCHCSVGGSAAPQQPQPAQTVVNQPGWNPTGPTQGPFGTDSSQVAVGTPAGTAKLIGMSGPMVGQAFILKAAGTTIGRSGDRDIIMSMDAAVSRNHAHVVKQNGAYSIVDEGSSNGTYVNGAKIASEVLRPGDVVHIGNTKFRFEE